MLAMLRGVVAKAGWIALPPVPQASRQASANLPKPVRH
jgi:hypothetical protein